MHRKRNGELWKYMPNTYVRTHTHTHTSVVNKFTWTTQEANQEQTANWGWFRPAVSAALDILSILGRAAREY